MLSLQSPAQPDVAAFGSACGVGSQRLGSNSGHLGSDRRASDFAGVLLSESVVCLSGTVFRSVYVLTLEGGKKAFLSLS